MRLKLSKAEKMRRYWERVNQNREIMKKQSARDAEPLAVNEELVFFKSRDGESDWIIVPPGEVPDWIKDPEMLGEIVSGQNTATMDGEWWYLAAPADIVIDIATDQNHKVKEIVQAEVRSLADARAAKRSREG